MVGLGLGITCIFTLKVMITRWQKKMETDTASGIYQCGQRLYYRAGLSSFNQWQRRRKTAR